MGAMLKETENVTNMPTSKRPRRSSGKKPSMGTSRPRVVKRSSPPRPKRRKK
jgi:hypothetical protein